MADRRPKQPCVYIMASRRAGALYTGMTCHLAERVATHKQDLIEGHTETYGIHRLVYYEIHETVAEAALRETRLKKWHRPWKFRLIEQMNPEWIDLYDETTGATLNGAGDLEWFRR